LPLLNVYMNAIFVLEPNGQSLLSLLAALAPTSVNFPGTPHSSEWLMAVQKSGLDICKFICCNVTHTDTYVNMVHSVLQEIQSRICVRTLNNT